ncbi:hypothetical protein LS67_008750 [Helicobacter sp. MIT 03-1616]|nr:hypothetical protein LS67_008750 [Helicobacter sp. MIT 03-1616]
MKIATISHIFSNLAQDFPSLAHKMRQQDDISRFKNTFLTPLEREQILFIIVKNDTLLFAFKHKALCVEFNHYKHKHIIESLKQHKEHFPALAHIQKIHAYTPSHILAPPPPPKPPVRYTEHSNGEFINHATDKILYEKFESLRLSIKRQWDTQNGA